MLVSSLISGFGSSLPAYRVVKSRMEAYRSAFAKQPMVKADVEYFRANIGKMKSSEEFVNNPRLLNFALTAFNLEDKSFAKAFIKKVLDEGADEKTDLAVRMVDPRYREMTEFFGMNFIGTVNFGIKSWVDKLVDRHLTQRFEAEAGEGNPAIRLALYFDRKAADAKSWYSVMGDTDLYEVMRTVAGMPASAVRQDIDKQKSMFEQKFKIEDLASPAKRGKIIDRFLAMYDAQNGPPTIAATSAAALIQPVQMSGFRTIVSLDVGMLAKLQSGR